MDSREGKRARPPRKLGRGLSQVSHIFLSAAEKPAAPGQSQDSEVKQAEDPRLWMPEAHLISLTSGEGVRGKTFLAANLAYEMEAAGRRVALVNADSMKPDVLDVTGAEVGEGKGPALTGGGFGRIPVFDLYDRMAGEVENQRTEGTDWLVLGVIERAARRVNEVVIDTSPGERLSRVIWRYATMALVICEPTSDKMRAAYVAIKRIRAVSGEARVGLVVNRVRGRGEAHKCFRKISGVARRFLKTNLRDYGYIVDSEAVAEACEKAIPLAQMLPGSEIAESIGSIRRLVLMDESAIAKRRREVTVKACASKEGR